MLQFNIIVLELYHRPEDVTKKYTIKLILLLLLLMCYSCVAVCYSCSHVIMRVVCVLGTISLQVSLLITTKFPKHHMEVLWGHYNLKGFIAWLTCNSHMN